ncbi:hypothetical protein [Streptomyces bluensis]|uniref:hypothetical protein n=1 Tax=Streptomyces bluensis TaxID=33897 RepID=UPI001675593C|nr:hypothetical protein [Streptomyces bluensis]GGZ76543.1 hypothetical protein GCM10010344_49430 [Streptomyces bluensis]
MHTASVTPSANATCSRAALLAAVTVVVLGALAPATAAASATAAKSSPLPLPAAESLVTESLVTVEGPLINNLTLPMTK